jgi:hypothetical protein
LKRASTWIVRGLLLNAKLGLLKFGLAALAYANELLVNVLTGAVLSTLPGTN